MPLLARLKHPLAAGGLRAGGVPRRGAPARERALRGPRPAPGIAGLRAALSRSDARAARRSSTGIERALAPLLAALAQARRADRATLVAAHIAAAEALAASDEESGAGAAVARGGGRGGGAIPRRAAARRRATSRRSPARDYPALFEALLAGPVVRPRFGRHPRLAIWGLLEARLQHADLLVLGGLNEGTWPAAAESDPWMSRPMRQQLRPAAAGAARSASPRMISPRRSARATVVLTRAARDEGAPTVPSRWLLRLDAVLRAGRPRRAVLGAASRAARLAGARSTSRRRCIAVPPPEPRPPVAARPRELSVTADRDLEARSLRDLCAPRSCGSKRSIRSMPIPARPSAASSSTRRSTSSCTPIPTRLPADADGAAPRASAREASAPRSTRPGVRAFWWPRFERIARWFVAHRERAPARGIGGIAARSTAARARRARPGRSTLTAQRRPHRPAARRRARASSTTRPAACRRPGDVELRLRAAAPARGGDRRARRLRRRRRRAPSRRSPTGGSTGGDPAGEVKRDRRGRRPTARADRRALAGLRRADRALRRSGDALSRRAVARDGAALFRLRASRARQGMVACAGEE